MTRMFGALALSVAAAACGGGSKTGATTTPKAGSGSADPTSMRTADPDAVNADGTPANPAGGSNGSGSNRSDASANGGGSNSAGSDISATADQPPPPPIVMPNLDPDPQAAKAQVEDHLKVARAALSAPTPDADTALREAKAALVIDGSNVDAAATVAFAYYAKHFYDTAELVLDDVFKRDAGKQNANVLYIYGLIYDKTNRPEQALAAYKQAVQLDPNLQSAQVNLGLHLLRNKSYADAQALFEKLHRTDAISLTLLGSAYRGHSADYQAGSPDRDQLIQRAQATYKRALEADHNYGPAYYDLGLLYLDADPFPSGGGALDTLQRLDQAKSYFDNYKDMPGVDMKLYDERMKDVAKAVKREQKKRNKKPSKGAPAGAAPAGAGANP